MSYSIQTLEKLAQLRREGALSEHEFSGLKAKLLASPAAPLWASSPMGADSDAQIIRRLSEYMKLSGIMWIVIGALQICMIFTAIAGVWNVAAGFSRLSEAKAITRRDHAVVESARGTTQLVVLGLINLVLGAAFGVIMIAVDFYVRDQILQNEHLFSGQPAEPHGRTTGEGADTSLAAPP